MRVVANGRASPAATGESTAGHPPHQGLDVIAHQSVSTAPNAIHLSHLEAPRAGRVSHKSASNPRYTHLPIHISSMPWGSTHSRDHWSPAQHYVQEAWCKENRSRLIYFGFWCLMTQLNWTNEFINNYFVV